MKMCSNPLLKYLSAERPSNVLYYCSVQKMQGTFFYMLTIDFMILSDATIIQWGVWESCDPTVEVSGEVETLLSSLMLSHPYPQVENVCWLDLNFLSRKGAPQVHDYCSKNTIIRHVLCLLLDLLCSLAFKLSATFPNH